MSTKLPHWNRVNTIVFDFDGVFTNNRVYVDESGTESIGCSRSDGLAFDMLRHFCLLKEWFPEYFILSKETNPVVSTRAKKLGIKCVQSIDNKLEYIEFYLNSNHTGVLIYLGNDLNDLAVMMHPNVFSVAPLDAHPAIIKIADVIIQRKGGDSFVRSFIEQLIGTDKMNHEELAQLV